MNFFVCLSKIFFSFRYLFRFLYQATPIVTGTPTCYFFFIIKNIQRIAHGRAKQTDDLALEKLVKYMGEAFDL